MASCLFWTQGLLIINIFSIALNSMDFNFNFSLSPSLLLSFLLIAEVSVAQTGLQFTRLTTSGLFASIS